MAQGPTLGDGLPFNPFASLSVGDPFYAHEPDVKSINGDIYDGLLKLIHQLPMTPNLGAIVYGDAGSGKTHLIKRLIRSRRPYACVYVQPVIDPSQMHRRLLKVMTSSLQQHRTKLEKGGDISDFMLLFAKVINRICQQAGLRQMPELEQTEMGLTNFLSNPKNAAQIGKIKTALKEAISAGPTEQEFIQVLFKYPLPEYRDDATVYLSGQFLDEEASKHLEIPRSPDHPALETVEMHASDVLTAFGRVFQFADPIIICFDQLENLSSPLLLQSFGRMVAHVIDVVPGVLPICFCKSDFADRELNELEQHVRERLFANPFRLRGCTLEEAIELVEARLAWAYQGHSRPSEDPLYPLTREKLEKVILGINSPRRVLREVNQLLSQGITVDDPVEIVEKTVLNEREHLLGANTKQNCFPSVILGILHQIFREQRDLPGNYRVKSVAEHNRQGLHLTLASNDGVQDTLIWCDERRYGLVEAFNQLTSMLESGEIQHAIFLRDERTPIPPGKGRMMKTVRAKKRFTQAGGQYLEMPYRWMAEIYALDRTRLAVGSQDLAYVTDKTGTVALVRQEHFDSYVTSRFSAELVNELLGIIAPTRDQAVREIPTIDPEELLSSILALLDRPPFIYRLDSITAHLGEVFPEIMIPDHYVLEVISSAKGKIHRLRSSPPIYSTRFEAQ